MVDKKAVFDMIARSQMEISTVPEGANEILCENVLSHSVKTLQLHLKRRETMLWMPLVCALMCLWVFLVFLYGSNSETGMMHFLLTILLTFFTHLITFDRYPASWQIILLWIGIWNGVWIIPWLCICFWGELQAERRLKEIVKETYLTYKNSHRKTLSDAKKRADVLCAIISGVEWSSVRDQIQQLARQTLPQLLSYLEELKDAIAKTSGLVDGTSPHTQNPLLQQAREDVAWYQKTLVSTEQRIEESQNTLRFLETSLRRAVLSRSQADLDAVTQHLSALNVSVGEVSKSIRTADAEIEFTQSGAVRALKSSVKQ